MMTKILALSSCAVLALSLSGCGTSQDKDASKSNKDNSMKGMKMGDQSLTKAFQDEFAGFSIIDQDVKKGDYQHAGTIANNLHDEFHASILPPLKDMKGAAYAEDIHGKYDALQDAISSKNNTKITEMLQVNRNNLSTTAKILGVSLK